MPKLPAIVKTAYGAGDFGFSVSYTIISFYLLFYLADVVKINPAWVGTAMLAAKVWDAVIDPFIGRFSDRLNTRWGRRRPFFLFCAVPFGITFLLLWTVPEGAGSTLTLVYVVTIFILHITVYSLIAVPYTSLTADLTNDYDERTSLTAYRMAFSIIAGLVAAVLPPVIVGMFPTKTEGYSVMGTVFGFVIILSPLLVFWGCRENTDGSGQKEYSFLEGLKLVLKNRPFRLVILMFLLTWLAVDIVSMTIMFFLKYVLDMEAYSEYIIGIIFIVATLFLPLWVNVSNRLDKRTGYKLGIGFLAIVLFFISMLGEGMTTAVYVLAVLAGVGVSAAHVFPYSIIPDCIEYDEMKTRSKRAGTYYGVISFLQQLASSLGVFMAGQVLNWSGYIPDAVQTHKAIACIKLLLGVVPGILLVIAITSISFYKIGREEHNKIKRIIAARGYNCRGAGEFTACEAHAENNSLLP